MFSDIIPRLADFKVLRNLDILGLQFIDPSRFLNKDKVFARDFQARRR
jgi:hypothetical protein